jgi:predicted MPP superfamily phosphohydrolase
MFERNRCFASRGAPALRARIAIFVGIVQLILFLAHVFIYETWVTLWGSPRWPYSGILTGGVAALSVSFVAATLLAHRYSNPPVRAFYRIASVWLGMLNFFFVAACLCWIAYPLVYFSGLAVSRHAIAGAFFGFAILASLYGIINAASIRVRRITVKLRGLPVPWRGRVAALVTDTHLGHVKGYAFLSRIVNKLRQLGADVVFFSGDLFDGTKVDAHRLVSPLKRLSPQFGSYFVTGNHEEFSDPTKYLDALKNSGVHVLHNEKVNLDGLQVVGVPYSESGDAKHYQSILEGAELDRDRASVLLAHVPHGLAVAEKQGISLQLSGHTHGGQIFPFTWFTNRIFGEFTYGLKRFGELLVYTSSGAGTWGPPMRVGTQPEIVLIRFE